ncbi:MAG: hypothetical protein RLY31_1854 [Bacteroidota bacterium]|jgi:hypothetical protein
MEKTLLFVSCLLLTVCFPPIGRAQAGDRFAFAAEGSGKVMEVMETMSEGIQNALVVTLDGGDAKLAEETWKSFLSDYGGKTRRVVRSNGEYVTTVEIVGINGVNPIQVYSRAGETEDGTPQLSTWFDLGEEYLSSKWKVQYEEAEKILLRYVHACRIAHTTEQLHTAEKKLRSMETDLERLERQHTGFRRTIEEAEKKIQQTQDEIVTNQQQQGDTMEKIELQKQLLEEIKRRLSGLKSN